MKIAIQGHPTRGEEVIQILESLGGINDGLHEGNNPDCYYELHGNIIWCVSTKGINFKYYTLEEFEKEFPFKIGDKIKHITSIGIIKEYCYINNEPAYKVKSVELGIIATIPSKILEPYKEMKKERNITLTLDKAKEWYKKGGELREIALQAFSEKELNPLPRSWEEYCRKYEYFCLSTRYTNLSLKYDALIKLEQLRNCWWNGWKPNWLEGNVPKHVIRKWRDKISIETTYVTHSFLSFPTYEMAEEFLECFRDLIEQTGDLI